MLSIAFFAALVIPSAYFFQGFQPWLTGLERFLTLAQDGQPAFFLGEYSYQGWWSYYLVAFLIKTPLGSLMLVALSLLLYRAGTRLKTRDAVFLLLPVIIILLATTQAKVNIGLRHILAVYPFLFILASRLATVPIPTPVAGAVLVGVSLILTIVSSLRVARHQLAYFDATIGGAGYRAMIWQTRIWIGDRI